MSFCPPRDNWCPSQDRNLAEYRLIFFFFLGAPYSIYHTDLSQLASYIHRQDRQLSVLHHQMAIDHPYQVVMKYFLLHICTWSEIWGSRGDKILLTTWWAITDNNSSSICTCIGLLSKYLRCFACIMESCSPYDKGSISHTADVENEAERKRGSPNAIYWVQSRVQTSLFFFYIHMSFHHWAQGGAIVGPRLFPIQTTDWTLTCLASEGLCPHVSLHTIPWEWRFPEGQPGLLGVPPDLCFIADGFSNSFLTQ